MTTPNQQPEVSAEAREAAPVALTISIDEDFGNGAFWSWFTSVWPEPKRTRHQHSNWVYRRDMAHAGWCAAAKEEIALRLQIAELKKKAPDPSAAAPVSVEAREAATRLFREYISQEECAEIIQRAIDRATEKLREEHSVEFAALKAEHDAALYMPGVYRCQKCNFELTKSFLYVKSGGIGPDLSAPEACPNDGETMQRVTWKEASASNYKFAQQLLDERDQLRAELQATKKQLEITTRRC